jgi:hypothetical protein
MTAGPTERALVANAGAAHALTACQPRALPGAVDIAVVAPRAGEPRVMSTAVARNPRTSADGSAGTSGKVGPKSGNRVGPKREIAQPFPVAALSLDAEVAEFSEGVGERRTRGRGRQHSLS